MTMTVLDSEARHGSGVYGSRGLAIVRGEGSTVWDAEGNSYIDCTSMYGTTILGQAHPRVTRAISEQAASLTGCFGSWAHDRRSRLYERLAARLGDRDRFFLCNSGAESLEAAIKVARHATGRSGLVAFSGGFHGRTMGALSLTFRPQYRRPFAPLLDDVQHAPLNDLEQAADAITENTAAVVVEAVQGEAGVRAADSGWLRGIEARCREVGALLVMDEVQTGLGRTGRWFAYEHAGLDPDLVCVAKGLGNGVPVAALAMGPRAGTLPFGAHGSTFGGNPIACAAAVATLSVIEDEQLDLRAGELGSWALDRLTPLADHGRVREVRGHRLMLAVELRARATPFIRALQARGILVLGAGPTTIRLLPPLNIERESLSRAIESIGDVVSC